MIRLPIRTSFHARAVGEYYANFRSRFKADSTFFCLDFKIFSALSKDVGERRIDRQESRDRLRENWP